MPMLSTRKSEKLRVSFRDSNGNAPLPRAQMRHVWIKLSNAVPTSPKSYRVVLVQSHCRLVSGNQSGSKLHGSVDVLSSHARCPSQAY